MPLAGTKRRRMTRRVTRRYAPKRPRFGGLTPSYRGFSPRQFTKGEWKYADMTMNVDMNTTGTFNNLINGLQVGNTASTRIGMKVAIRTLEIRARALVKTDTSNEQVCRWFVYIDNSSNAAAPAAITDILDTATPTSFRNLVNRRRFKIILDKSFPMGSSDPTAQTGTPTSRFWHVYYKFRRPIIVEYNLASNGTISDIISGAMFVGTCGTIPAGVDDCNLVLKTRIRYTDL